MTASIIVNDEWLKRNCFLFKGSVVKILQQKGNWYDCETQAGKYVRLRASEIKIKNNPHYKKEK